MPTKNQSRKRYNSVSEMLKAQGAAPELVAKIDAMASDPAIVAASHLHEAVTATYNEATEEPGFEIDIDKAENIIQQAINTALSTQSATIAEKDALYRVKCDEVRALDEMIVQHKEQFADQQKRIEELEGIIRTARLKFVEHFPNDTPGLAKMLEFTDKALSSPGQEFVRVEDVRPLLIKLRKYIPSHGTFSEELINEYDRVLAKLTPNQQEKGKSNG